VGDATLLVIGLAGVAGALALGLAAAVIGIDDRRRVQRQLATVNAMRATGMPVLDLPEEAFADRVLTPLLARCTVIGRRLSPSGFAAKLQRRLDLAGNPAAWTADRVLAFKVLGLLMAGLVAFALAGTPATKLLFAAGAAAAGFFLPDLLIYNLALKRQSEIQKALPDSIDLLTISVEAGLGFDAAVSQVARNTDGPLAGELIRVLQEMQIGKSRTEAFRSLADRTNVGELRAFVSSMVQADAFGIPVANVLREQSREMRVKRRQRAEERAQKVPVKIKVPLVMFIFPCLFIVIIGPAAIKIMNSGI
jgi:tight adherence protein C